MADGLWPRDPFVWLDPKDAVFVHACREALAIERRAWEAADKERRELRAEVERLRRDPSV